MRPRAHSANSSGGVEELAGGDEAHAAALEPSPGRRGVGLRAHDVALLPQHVGEALDAAPLVDLHLAALAQLGREVAHRAQHEVPALAVVGQPGEAGARLDEQHAVGARERRIAVGELVAEDEGRVAHQRLTAR